MEILRVSCAIIIENNNILCCQRPAHKSMGLKWEFPGGKMEVGETKKESIMREIKEELNIEIEIIKALKSYKTELEDVIIELIPFICSIRKGKIISREHENTIWLKKEELFKLNWAEPDIPLMKYLNSISDF